LSVRPFARWPIAPKVNALEGINNFSWDLIMGILLNVIDIFKYSLKLVKITGNLHGPGKETLALFVPRRNAVKSG
jgi:hypothetical protein